MLRELATNSKSQNIILLLLLAFPLSYVVHPKLGSILGGMIFLFGILMAWKKAPLAISEKYFLSGLFLFPLLSLITVIFSPDISDDFSKWGRILNWWLAIPAYLAIKRYYSIQITRYFPYTIALSAIGLFIWALIDKVNGVPRAGGLMNAILFGDLSALACIICLFLAYRKKNAHLLVKSFFFISGLLALLACIWSVTRGAWLALLLSPFISLWILGNIKLKFISVACTMVITTIISVGVVNEHTWAKQITRIVDEVQVAITKTPECTSSGARFIMWENAVTLFKGSPWVGVGLSQYSDSAEKLVKSGQSRLGESCDVIYKHTAHSIFFHTLAVSGLTGIIGLLGMFILCIVSVLKTSSSFSEKWQNLTLVFMFILFGATTTWIAKSLSIYIFLIFIITHLAIANRSEKISN